MKQQLKTALIQSSLVWENPEVNRKVFLEKIQSISDDTDVVLLPEMFTTGFTMNPSNIDASEGRKTVQWMQQIANAKNVAVVGSMVYNDKGENHNRLWFVKPNEQPIFYDKRHTFTLAGEDKVYKAGALKLIVEYKGFKFCPLICYDLRFPVWARNTDNYDVLIYVANWPKVRVEAWDTLLKARAIENMTYCIGVNRIGLDGVGHEYSGHSAVYNSLGELVAYSDKEEIFYATLSKEHIDATRENLKFLNDKDDFTLKG